MVLMDGDSFMNNIEAFGGSRRSNYDESNREDSSVKTDGTMFFDSPEIRTYNDLAGKLEIFYKKCRRDKRSLN